VGVNSTCYLDNSRFGMRLHAQVYSCNSLEFQFEMTGTDSLLGCTFAAFLASDNLTAALNGYSYNPSTAILTYSYSLTETIEKDVVRFDFNPTTLYCLSDAFNFITVTITTIVNSDNNAPAIYYPAASCNTQQQIETLVSAVEYSSFAALLLSALPCKIVGLELFGVLQLSFLSLGSMDNLNLMLTPLKDLKATNGLNLDIGDDAVTHRLLQSFTP
jgi:hypothetical protein